GARAWARHLPAGRLHAVPPHHHGAPRRAAERAARVRHVARPCRPQRAGERAGHRARSGRALHAFPRIAPRGAATKNNLRRHMTSTLPSVAGIPVDFILFAITLACVAIFHHHTLRVAVIGLVVITAYKLVFTDFAGVPGASGLLGHLRHEWVTIANLFGLLLGFALLSKHFEDSRLPAILPNVLPDDWKGGFVMLIMVFVLSSFLDNIAAAMIGGTMANTLFRGRLHVGFLAAIVAASNAGGAGSVVGDTTTTMMWIAGVPPLQVFDAYVAAV